MAGNESEDFTDIINKAQRVDKDIGGLFGNSTPGRVAFEPRPDRAGPEHDWDAHIDVFNLPADKEGYEDVMNKCLRGEATVRYERDTFTKEGDFMVAICYLTPHERPRPAADEDAGDAEPEVRPRRMP
jgi:hypothetical protein